MHILVFQQAAWENTNAVGNTLSNWFSNWNDDVFANFYTRKQYPDNEIVDEYYNISATDIVKESISKIQKHHFSSDEIKEQRERLLEQREGEQHSIDLLHKNNNEFIYLAMESIWLSKKWLNDDFKKFVNDFKPDIFFAFCTSVYILAPLIDYLKINTDAKIVLFIADDVYGYYSKRMFVRRRYLSALFKKCIANADKIYGVTEELSAEYGRIFNVDITPLYKGCELNEKKKKKRQSPLKLVYAGNLYYGRDKTLEMLADELESINKESLISTLEIYTGSTITDDIKRKLDHGFSSQIIGKKPFEEIREILSDADVVLHVESFDQDDIDCVKYSFSTKIIDCLDSGSLIMGIGPEVDASISYIDKIPGSFVAYDSDGIRNAIETIVKMSEDEYNNRINSIWNYSKDTHDVSVVRTQLRNDFLNLVS